MLEIRETLAVVDDSQFYYVENLKGKTVGHEIDCLSALLEDAEIRGWSHVWVMPNTGVFTHCSYRQEIPGWKLTQMGDDTVEFMSAQRVGARADSMIYVGFIDFENIRWPWKDRLPDAKTLLQTVAMLENALGEPLEWTPAHMSMRIVRRLNERRWSWWEPLTIEIEKPEYGLNYANDIAQELHWPARGVEPTIPDGATHLIRIDGNSDYAAAMTGLNIGQGNPEWTDSPESVYDGKKPGFWRVDTTVSSLGWLARMGLDKDLEARRWMTTDMIEQLRRLNVHIKVELGWFWPDDKKSKKPRYHQALRTTAEYLWAMRNNYRDMVDKGPAYANTYDTIRAVIKAIHGKMAHPNTETHFRRRDVWALVVARAVAMRLYKIEKIYREYGVLPVRIKADEFTYAVTDPHIFDGMLGTAKLGGFKLVECVEIQPVSKVD